MLLRKSLLTAGALLATAGLSLFAARAARAPVVDQFEEMSMSLRVDTSEEDIAIDIALEVAEAFLGLVVHDPFGELLLDVKVSDPAGLGLTELAVQAKQADIREGLAAFPAGTYTITAFGVDGKTFAGDVELSHQLPVRPRILSPADRSVVDPEAFVVTWGGGVNVDHHVVEVMGENLDLRVEVPPHVRSFHVPPSLLRSDTVYEVEVSAVNEAGNSIVTELRVRTAR